jgi:hypothetical protein
MEEKPERSSGLSQAEYEARSRVIALSILEKVDRIVAWDLEMNQHFSNLAGELVRQLKENPRILESRVEAGDILRGLSSEQVQGKGYAGGDIQGGDPWDDIWGVIKDVLTGEKDFVKEIITKLLKL